MVTSGFRNIAISDELMFTDTQIVEYEEKIHALANLRPRDQEKVLRRAFSSLVEMMEPTDVVSALMEVKGNIYTSQAVSGAEHLVRSFTPFVDAESLLFFLATEDKRFKVENGAVTLASKEAAG